jgi:hypothetical protein
MNWTARLLVAILATWRMAALLVYEHWFLWLRQLVHTDFVDDEGRPLGFLGKVLGCFWCTTFVVAIAVSCLMILEWDWVLIPFALSAGAIALNHWTRIVRYVGE